jgi:hypothetical protein
MGHLGVEEVALDSLALVYYSSPMPKGLAKGIK